MWACTTRKRHSGTIEWSLIPLIGLVAAWPFLTQSLPSTDDGALHMLRLVEIDRCLRHGVLPLRWAPDFAHGYGYPFFNYYASLSSYIAELWHLIGLNFPQAIAGATITALVFSGWGAYLLGRDLGTKKAGLVAATAYMYAPYQFYDSAYRGNLAETWALALLPWVLWTGRRAAVGHRWRDIVPCALAYAALTCTHNVYALISTFLLGAYLLLLWWTGERSWRNALRLCATIGLGLALSAFFWLPAFFEKGWTHFATDLVDYRTFFLPVKELLAWPPQVDLSRLNFYPPRSLSWGALLLIGPGIVLRIVAVRRKPTFHAPRLQPGIWEWAFFVVVLLFSSFMTVRLSDWVWRTVPLLNFALIPWRYLGIASLAGSLIAGATIAHLPDRPTLKSPALIGTVLAIALLIAMAIPWTYAAPFPQPQKMGVPNMIRWEYNTHLIGTTAKNEYLPIWSPQLPPDPADPALLAERDPIIARLDAASLPKGAQVLSANYGLMRANLIVQTPQAFRARYKQLYFPGWKVTVDGQAVPPIATHPYGLLGFDVPAGRHRIVVQPATTPLRLTGEAITVLAVLAAIGVVTLDRRQTRIHPPPRPGAASMLSRAHWIAIAVLALAVLAIKEGIVDRTENLFRAHQFGHVPGVGERIPGVQTETQINFGNMLTLHGYDLPTHPVVAGEPLRVDLYLSARQPVDGDYMAYARLVDEERRLWSLRDNGTPEGFRPPPATTIWPGDAYGHWAYLAHTLPGTPPGAYWVEIAIFERGTWRGLNVLDEQGQIAGQRVTIGPVQIDRPRTPPEVDTLGIEQQLSATVLPDLQCLGSTLDVTAASPGETIDLTLFWQAAGRMERDYGLRLAIASKANAFLLADALPLGRHEHPTTAWEEGEIVRSPHRLRVPAAVDGGKYIVEGTLIDALGRPVAAPIAIAEITVKSLQRTMVVPAGMQHIVGANLGHQVTLLGYDLPKRRLEAGTSLPVTLYWRAEQEMHASYKAFVQLIGADGVLAQVDAVPAGWRRPTTGWVSGEVIVDPYDLPVPAGAPPARYQLIVGMYDEATLQRLAVLDASGKTVGDHVSLGEVTVE